MRFGKYRFVPAFWPSLFFVLLMPVFLSLGLWQLNRADEKAGILAELEDNKNSPARNIGSINVDVDMNSRVSLSGQILGAQQFLLDNKVHNSVAGYEVITPVRLKDDGRFILVSRGWVAQGKTRSELPGVELQSTKLEKVTGLFTRPSKGYTIGESFDKTQEQWPKVIQYLDYPRMADVLGASVIEGVVQLDNPIGTAYPKLWKPVAFGPEKHIGYALQWFAVALTLLVLYIVLNTKKEDKHIK